MDEIKAIRERQERQQETLGMIQKSVSRMETALLGDEEAGVEGIVRRINRHGEYIRGSKKRFTYAAGFTAGAIAIWELVKQTLR